MLKLTFEIEHSQYKGVYRISPSFDATTASEEECDIFMDLLERIAPGIDFDDSIDEQMAYLTDAVCGAHDEEGPEADPNTEIVE